MNIFMPDEYPGRCKNHREINWYARPKTVRCLDYEGTEHVCTFEQPPVEVHLSGNIGLSRSVAVDPKPWVKPPVTEENKR